MTTEKRPVKKSSANKSESPEVTTTDNKSVFGPLGKYAVVAVIMVSIIVTTAIMLNKQLNTVDDQIAVLENEIADINSTQSDTVAIESNTTDASVAAITTETQTDQQTSEAAPASEEVVVAEATPAPTATEQAVSAQTTDAAAAEIAAMQTTEATSADPATRVTPEQTRQSQLANTNQARIEAYKREQKQRMSEMFARIRTLEAQQLDQYKANQDKRIERLRGQITRQQEVIEALILRNDESLKMRETSLQRNQTNREQILNRI